MRSRIASISAALFVAAALSTPAARADVPPPSGYVEECTVERQCPGGRSCGTYHGESNPECAKAAQEAGMEERCHSWGATVGGSVFCPKGAPVPKKTEKPEKSDKPAPRAGGCGGCATSAGGEAIGPASTLAIAIAIGAVVRRVRRTRPPRRAETR
jgi:hypothetical protein